MDRLITRGSPRLAPPDCRCRHCATRRAAVLLAVEATVLDAERRRALALRDEVLAEWLRPTAVAP